MDKPYNILGGECYGKEKKEIELVTFLKKGGQIGSHWKGDI